MKIEIPPPVFTVKISMQRAPEFYKAINPRAKYADTLATVGIFCGNTLVFERWFHDEPDTGYGQPPVKWGDHEVYYSPFDEKEMGEETMTAFGKMLKERLGL